MNKHCYLILTIIFFLICCIPKLYAQDEEFLVGAFIASSPDSNYTLHNNYYQVLDCGFNSVWQNATRIGEPKNLDSLAQFKYLYLLNDMAPEHTTNPDEIDWISYFTHAKYFRWEAEGDQNFPIIDTSDTISAGIRHEFGYPVPGVGWRSGTDPANIGKNLVDGPNYTQYMKYVYTNRWWPNPYIQYKAVFRLKLADPQENTFDVAEIRVVLDTSWIPLDTLASLTLTTDTLSTDYKEFTLTYSYDDLPYENPGYTVGYTPPPGSDWIPMQGTAATPWLDGRQKIHFQVEWLGNAEIIVDYVEVYDEQIWETYFILDPELLVSRISTYNQDFANLNSSFYSNLKYYGTTDEPHTWDSFIPIKEVQEILDNLSTGKDLLVHFYPGWNNYREGKYNVLEKWVNIAQPKKLMFWYAPFTCDASVSPCDPYPREFTLNNFHNYVLQPAHLLQPDFYVTLQSWGTVNQNTGNYIGYMTPTPAELNAGTMLSLAHGVKGIYYEIYYSYESVAPKLVEGLVDLNFDTTSNWNKVQELTLRLKGKLGSTLLSTNYTGNYLQLRYFLPSDDPLPTPPTYDYLTLGQNPSAQNMNWHAGFLVDSSHSDNKYFLLANLWTTANKSVQVKVTEPVSGYDNYRFRNVEDGYFDTTFATQIIKTLSYTKGEGYLYQVAPVVKYGGKLIANDTVDASINLIDNMTIGNGVDLLIDDGGYYTTEDTITLQGTGFITGDGYFDRDEEGWVILNSWDYSVFKGREGDHPKIQWGEHPTIQNVNNYKIYRDKASGGWQHLITVSNSTFEYIDSTVTIITGPAQGNEVAAHYYVTTVWRPSKVLVETDPSNTITYRRVEGSGQEKRGTGLAGEVYTYSLQQNYPNPFNPTTTIQFSLEKDGFVELDIIDILGRRVESLINDHKTRGNHIVKFDASKLASGIYFYRIKSRKFVQTKKMILLK